MSTYLVIGGTGKVGSRLARILQNTGNDVRIASRTGGDVRFDWQDSASYRPALAGVEAVFIVGPGSATDWSPLLRELLVAAEAQGVQRAVFLSARGVEFLPDGRSLEPRRRFVRGPSTGRSFDRRTLHRTLPRRCLFRSTTRFTLRFQTVPNLS